MNALRLALGTLTVFPTKPPTVVDRRVAGLAMALAPLVSLVLVVPLWLLSLRVEHHWSPLLTAVMWVGGLAFLTRAMHLDGLSDTADGLGSGKPAGEALAIMRKSDVGPFGVATLVLVLLAQVAAATQLIVEPDGVALVAVAVVWSRLVLPAACLVGTPAAREEGLGAMVAGSVSWPKLLGSYGVAQLGVVGILLVSHVDWERALTAAIAVIVGRLFCTWCVRRLGGITGDVLGACVEVTFTVALLGMCLYN
ncbi:MAG TPA: adenosylcobinamide-GDP ribazoletransferase [Nocardioidaceae bacterium]|nr:adenosylcobinamide-GDP ribazoletransferase [Nocardioidaceae bacterium]